MALKVKYLNDRGCCCPTYRMLEPDWVLSAFLYLGCMDSKG